MRFWLIIGALVLSVSVPPPEPPNPWLSREGCLIRAPYYASAADDVGFGRRVEMRGSCPTIQYKIFKRKNRLVLLGGPYRIVIDDIPRAGGWMLFEYQWEKHIALFGGVEYQVAIHLEHGV